MINDQMGQNMPINKYDRGVRCLLPLPVPINQVKTTFISLSLSCWKKVLSLSQTR